MFPMDTDNKKLYTRKELADMCGVTKTTVLKHLNSMNIQPTIIEKGVFLYDETAKLSVFNRFKNTNNTGNDASNQTDKLTDNQLLMEIKTHYEKVLDDKDNDINYLKEKLDESQRLLDQQQQLQQQAIKELNELKSLEAPKESPPTNKSWWKRFTNK